MAGHSRWAQVKHRKAGADAKRSARFSKFVRLITMAAREGGGDPAANPKLRAAIEQARSASLPGETIERAVSRAATGGRDEALLERRFEAYGPGGGAYLIQAVTASPNRTANELKSMLAEHGGRLAEAGSVAWLFERRALITLHAPAPEEREAAELALIEAGATDVTATAGGLSAHGAPEDLDAFLRAAAERGLTVERAAVAMVPKAMRALGPEERRRAQALAQALEDHPDVTAVWANFGPPA